MSFTHCSLPQVKHDILLHLVDVLLKILIVLGVLRLATTVEPHPYTYDGSGDGHGDGEVDP